MILEQNIRDDYELDIFIASELDNRFGRRETRLLEARCLLAYMGHLRSELPSSCLEESHAQSAITSSSKGRPRPSSSLAKFREFPALSIPISFVSVHVPASASSGISVLPS